MAVRGAPGVINGHTNMAEHLFRTAPVVIWVGSFADLLAGARKE